MTTSGPLVAELRPDDASVVREPLRPRFRLPHQNLSLIIAVIMALTIWIATGIPITPVRPWLPAHLLQISLFLMFGAFGLLIVRSAGRIARGRRIGKRRARVLIARHVGFRTIARMLHFVLAFAIVMTVHTSIKQAIPLINPLNWDAPLISLERAVHFGVNPAWDLARCDTPLWLTQFLDACYFWWFPSIPLIAAFFLTHRHRSRREHYAAAFTALWVVGILIGLAFPSHGPCYVDRTTFPAPGMDVASMIQTWLWDHYVSLQAITLSGDGGLKFGCGLMAMPSMHIAVVSLYALFLWKEGGLYRWGSLVYAMLVFVGSLYSGWHYAVDGYMGLGIAALCLFLTRPQTGILRRAA